MWCGMVWYGAVWFVVVWYGMVRFELDALQTLWFALHVMHAAVPYKSLCFTDDI